MFKNCLFFLTYVKNKMNIRTRVYEQLNINCYPSHRKAWRFADPKQRYNHYEAVSKPVGCGS